MLSESIEILNERLVEFYGNFAPGMPNWRIVYSEDQFEKRKTEYTREGFKMLNPIVTELPKYRQWIHNKYVLERVIPVPEGVECDLVDSTSYEPIWVFEHATTNEPLPPVWPVCYVVVESVMKAAAQKMGIKYKDPYSDPKEAPLIRKQELDELQLALFGEQIDDNVADALHHGEGVVVPNSYQVENESK